MNSRDTERGSRSEVVDVERSSSACSTRKALAPTFDEVETNGTESNKPIFGSDSISFKHEETTSFEEEDSTGHIYLDEEVKQDGLELNQNTEEYSEGFNDSIDLNTSKDDGSFTDNQNDKDNGSLEEYKTPEKSQTRDFDREDGFEEAEEGKETDLTEVFRTLQELAENTDCSKSLKLPDPPATWNKYVMVFRAAPEGASDSNAFHSKGDTGNYTTSLQKLHNVLEKGLDGKAFLEGGLNNCILIDAFPLVKDSVFPKETSLSSDETSSFKKCRKWVRKVLKIAKPQRVVTFGIEASLLVLSKFHSDYTDIGIGQLFMRKYHDALKVSDSPSVYRPDSPVATTVFVAKHPSWQNEGATYYEPIFNESDVRNTPPPKGGKSKSYT